MNEYRIFAKNIENNNINIINIKKTLNNKYNI